MTTKYHCEIAYDNYTLFFNPHREYDTEIKKYIYKIYYSLGYYNNNEIIPFFSSSLDSNIKRFFYFRNRTYAKLIEFFEETSMNELYKKLMNVIDNESDQFIKIYRDIMKKLKNKYNWNEENFIIKFYDFLNPNSFQKFLILIGNNKVKSEVCWFSIEEIKIINSIIKINSFDYEKLKALVSLIKKKFKKEISNKLFLINKFKKKIKLLIIFIKRILFENITKRIKIIIFCEKAQIRTSNNYITLLFDELKSNFKDLINKKAINYNNTFGLKRIDGKEIYYYTVNNELRKKFFSQINKIQKIRIDDFKTILETNSLNKVDDDKLKVTDIKGHDFEANIINYLNEYFKGHEILPNVLFFKKSNNEYNYQEIDYSFIMKEEFNENNITNVLWPHYEYNVFLKAKDEKKFSSIKNSKFNSSDLFFIEIKNSFPVETVNKKKSFKEVIINSLKKIKTFLGLYQKLVVFSKIYFLFFYDNNPIIEEDIKNEIENIWFEQKIELYLKVIYIAPSINSFNVFNLSEKIEYLEKKLDSQKEDFEKKLESQKEDYEKQKEYLEKQKENFEKKLESQKEDYEKQKEDYEKQKEDFEKKLESQKEDYEKQKEYLEKKLESQKEDFEKYKEYLEKKLESQKE